MTVVKGGCACDAQRHTFDIGVFKSDKQISTTINHIYNASVNLTDSCNVAFDINDCFYFP